MAEEKKIQDDPRFSNVPSAGEPVQVNDQGVAKVEDLGDGLVKVVDRDGRVSVLPLDVEPTNMSAEQRQKAIDVLVENSPGKNELNPAHSDYDPSLPAVEAPKVDEDKLNVVNKDLGVDKQDSAPASSNASDNSSK